MIDFRSYKDFELDRLFRERRQLKFQLFILNLSLKLWWLNMPGKVLFAIVYVPYIIFSYKKALIKRLRKVGKINHESIELLKPVMDRIFARYTILNCIYEFMLSIVFYKYLIMYLLTKLN